MDAEEKEWLSFESNTTTTNNDGRWQIDCNKGFWGVDAPDIKQATREAHHYFRQYYFDGEYN